MNPLRVNFKGNGYPTRGRVALLYEGQQIHAGDVELEDPDSRATFCDEATRLLHNPDARGLIDGLLEKELVRAERLIPVSAAKLVKRYPNLRDPIVSGLLRRGEILNFNNAAKAGKTWTSIGLSLSVASGRRFLDTFDTARVPVLHVDNELHVESISYRVQRVAAAMGIDLSDLGDDLQILSLRGRLRDVHALKQEFARLRFRPGLICLDALYRLQPKDFHENDNAAMTTVYNTLDTYAADLDAAFVAVHHSSRGLQVGKSVTDVGAGAGAQSRAADTHLIMRQHEADDAYTVEAAPRSWPPLDPFCVRWEFPLWKPAPDLDPSELREVNRPRAAKGWTPERFVDSFVKSDPRRQAAIIADAKAAKLSERFAKDMLVAAENNGLAFRWKGREATDPLCWATVNQHVMEGAL